MNKKIGLISGIAIATIIGGIVLLSNGKKEEYNSNKATIKVEHAIGTTNVVEEPQRIIVFDWAMLDVIDTLNIEGVVGVPKSGSIPDYLSEYEDEKYSNVGGLKEPNLEKIKELNPDLILINGRQHSFYEKLSAIAPTISMSKEDGKYLESTTKNFNIIGDIFNKEKEVEKELKLINEKVEEINKKVNDKGYTATTIMTSNGELSVFGEKSRFGLIYNEIGFESSDKNIKEANHGQNVSFEYLASQDADYIFVVDKSVIMNDKEQKPAKELLNNELVKSTEAAKNDNIVYLDTQAWYLSDGGITSTNIILDEVNSAISK